LKERKIENKEFRYITKKENDLEKAYTNAINILRNIEPQSPFIFENRKEYSNLI